MPLRYEFNSLADLSMYISQLALSARDQARGYETRKKCYKRDEKLAEANAYEHAADIIRKSKLLTDPLPQGVMNVNINEGV